MNPAIIIPTYWAADPTQIGVYDHATALDEPLPELARCLDSLDDVRGIVRTIILVVAKPADEKAARARVNAIVRDHAYLNPVVIGSAEARFISGAIDEVCPNLTGEVVSLRGYGAIRNMGLAVAAIFGHDVAVFMDDDEVALSDSFLVDAVYGLGMLTRQDLRIYAKTGHFIDSNDSHLADESKAKFWERWWSKRAEFNTWMKAALAGTRICRSNYVCGGCLAVHAEAFSRVAFDPWITRGEDLDYLFNLRLLGLEMWFDNKWFVRHLPPASADEPNRFLQDIYRWVYERAKLAYCSQDPSLRQVTPASLMPYPGRWLLPELESRATRTALARTIAGPNRLANFKILTSWKRDTQAYASQRETSYLRMISMWPDVINGLWGDEELAAIILKGTPKGKSKELS